METSTPSGRWDLRHLSLLEAVDGRGNISQRELARALRMPLAQVNRAIRGLVADAHLEVVDPGVRPFAYRLTESGRNYMRALSHGSYREVLRGLRRIRSRIRRRLEALREEEIRRVAFYGAGEIFDLTLPLARKIGLQVVGVVDDDPGKVGRERRGMTVGRPKALEAMAPDAVVITSFRHGTEIRSRLEGGDGRRLVVVEL
jgi:DNA-binding MarR family transcriptional regulator